MGSLHLRKDKESKRSVPVFITAVRSSETKYAGGFLFIKKKEVGRASSAESPILQA